MFIRILLLGVILAFLHSGCAMAVSPSRESYILAKPHGWIELTVVDQQIPARPPGKEEDNPAPKPPWCKIRVEFNREDFLSDPLFPLGDTPPYYLDTGFRFAVPVGRGTLVVRYNDCRVQDGKLSDKRFVTQVEIQEGFITPVLLNGEDLMVGALTPNTKATLEEVNQRLINLQTHLNGQ